MKKFKHLWLAGLLLAATVGFTSCDDDDDNREEERAQILRYKRERMEIEIMSYEKLKKIY